MRYYALIFCLISGVLGETTVSAAFRDADRCIAEGRIDSAIIILTAAVAQSPSATTRHELARVLLASGDTAAATRIWEERARGDGGDRSFKAQYHLGILSAVRGNDSAARRHLALAAAACDEEWRFPILYASAEVALSCGDTAQGRIFVRDLSKRYGKYVGKAHLDSLFKAPRPSGGSGVAVPQKPSPPADTLSPPPGTAMKPSLPAPKLPAAPAASRRDSVWVLQVGAFTQRENASRGARELGKKFPKLAEGVLEPLPGSTYYRAVLGAFPTEQKALTAGREILSPKEIKFRVVRGLPSPP